MKQSFALLLIVLVVGCSAGSLPAGNTGATPDRKPAAGTLFIVGGGYQSPDLVRQFVDLAGGARARIAILPMATSDAVATGADKEAQLDSLGADSFVFWPSSEGRELEQIHLFAEKVVPQVKERVGDRAYL